ncbi:hypothetical protein H0X06_03465 [Candidatus Dependentiae bacterium]|nr:hypothetical protein [Candidatus Dependentiae bacterium]
MDTTKKQRAQGKIRKHTDQERSTNQETDKNRKEVSPTIVIGNQGTDRGSCAKTPSKKRSAFSSAKKSDVSRGKNGTCCMTPEENTRGSIPGITEISGRGLRTAMSSSKNSKR